MRHTKVCAAVAAVLCSALATESVRAAPGGKDDSARLRKALTVNGILRHEKAFQAIARRSGGIRAAGTVGYDRSVDYVTRELRRSATRSSCSSSHFRSSRSWATPPSFGTPLARAPSRPVPSSAPARTRAMVT
jgi:hypothetical protein